MRMKNLMCGLTLVAGLVFANPESTEIARAEVFGKAKKCENMGADSSPTVSDTGQSSDAGCKTGSNSKCDRVRTETAVSQNCVKFDEHCCLPYEFTPYTCSWKCVKVFVRGKEVCVCRYEEVEGNTVTQQQTVDCTVPNARTLSKCKDTIDQPSCPGEQIPKKAEDCEDN